MLLKAVFRFRALVKDFFFNFPRTLFWKAVGVHVGNRTILPKIYINWPHQVSLGSRCLIEPGVVFKFDGICQPGPSLIFGDEVFIGTLCEFNIRQGIEVGSNCLIASGCKFIDYDHGHATRLIPIGKQLNGATSKILISEDVWIGANVIVLKGVTIGKGAVIAAGTVLTKSVGPFEIWAGVPGRKIRDRPRG
jgi:acetyltransferase-like isoleucine patch superfamily enzyme